MWDYTLHEFKCPYCGYCYKTTISSGRTYLYKGTEYSAVEHPCPKCGKSYLYGRVDLGDDDFIKMPEDKRNLKFLSSWIS